MKRLNSTIVCFGLITSLTAITGCAGDDGRLSSEELERVATSQSWSAWIETSPGVLQRSSPEGALQTQGYGVAGFDWLVEQYEREFAEFKARTEQETIGSIDSIDNMLRFHEERLTATRNRLEALRVAEALQGALSDANTAFYKLQIGGPWTINTLNGTCEIFAYSYQYDSIVAAYGQGSCTSSYDSYFTAAYTQVDSNMGGTSGENISSSEWQTCHAGSSYLAQGSVYMPGWYLVTSVSGTCQTYL